MKCQKPLRRGPWTRPRASLRRVSAKRRRSKLGTKADPVYQAVDRRSQGRCEVVLVELLGRCYRLGEEHHHTKKPRASSENHVPERIIHVCKIHHRMASREYRDGRLEMEPNGNGTFHCRVAIAPDKWAARAIDQTA